jgi:hypothetical protein
MAEQDKDIQRDPHLWKEKDRKNVLVILKDSIRLKGTAHLVRNQRLLDLVNAADHIFLPLTNVTVHNEQTGQTIDTDFVAVNKAEVLLITGYSDKIEEALDGTRWSK